MPNIITKEVKGTGFSPVEALLVATSKVLSESLLARIPLVGNSTIKSGLIKMGLAGGLGYAIGKTTAGKAIATGLVVDGAEDLVTRFIGGSTATSGNVSVGGNTANLGVANTGAI